ncbi:MAG TPA: efflux RND transporter permease subunit [Gemmatimonadaceae bacterium]|nr:efflux RND transporter permease subunit [Gemmatimonadaceae bacterium]
MIRWAVNRPAVVWAAAVAILVSGSIAFTRLALATKTNVEFPRLTIRASWAGASAELMEMHITAPIEAAVQGVRGVRKTSSTSSEGGSMVNATLDPDADVQLTRLAILERMEVLRTDSAFPDRGIRPSVSNYVPEALQDQPLLIFSVTGPYTPGSLQKIVNEQVVPRISAVSGVGGVNAQQTVRVGVAVIYDPQLLRQLQIRPEVLSQALRDSRLVRSLGDEVLGASVRHVILRDEPKALEELAALPIRNARGRIFRLGELARLTPEEDAQGSFSRIDGHPSMTMYVFREPTADAIKTADAALAGLEEVKPTLPPGIRFAIARNESVELGKKLTDLEIRGLIAFIAVTLVLLVTLRNARATALVMGSAAIAIAGTALGLYVLKIPANMLTLAGLGMGIGILVQDAIVVVDRLATVPDTPEARAGAARRILPAIIGATMTTIVVLIPFLYLQGNARAAFFPFAAAFALALVWSVLAAVVMVPAMGRGHGLKPRQSKWAIRSYSWVLRKLVIGRWATVVVSAVAIAWLGWHFYRKVPRYSWGGFGDQRSYISVSVRFPRGSNPDNLDRLIGEFERIALGREGVERVTVNGGMQGAQMRVDFTEAAEMTAAPAILYDEMTSRGVLVGGASVGVYGYGQSFSSGGGGGSSSTFRVKILGYSYDEVGIYANDLKERLESIPRVRDVRVTSGGFGWGGERTYMVTLTPDRAALARYGITAAAFRDAITREVSGGTGTTPITINGEEVLVALKSEGARERTMEELREAFIPSSTGAPVRIGDISTVGEQESLSTIDREDQQYVRMLTYDFRGPAKLANRTHKAFMGSISVPAGFSVGDASFSWGGEDDSDKGLWMVFGLGVVLVVLAVAMVFDSVWAAWMVLISLPLALAGVMAAFILAKAAFTREAAVGVILVVGLAVHQGILLIDAALEHRRSNQRRFGSGRLRVRDAFRAAMDRAGMITIVTLSTLASLLPLAINTKTTDMFGGIALATAGGTIAGTLGAMLVMPALVALAVRRRRTA